MKAKTKKRIMKKRLLLILCFILLTNTSFGQDMKTYGESIIKAEKLYDAKEYKESADNYKVAFDALGGGGGPDDTYYAARSNAMAGNIDTAFELLFKLSKYPEHYGLSGITKLEFDEDFKSLKTNKRWEKLLKVINTHNEKLEVNLDHKLVKILDKVFTEDQEHRKSYLDIVSEFGRESNEAKASLDKMKINDSINLNKVENILDTKGWLGADVIGDKGNITLFLVIQHANPETQRKYLPIMREAFKNGNAKPDHLAYLEDRVALWKGEKQIYGTQVGKDNDDKSYVLPLKDPENVDVRRKAVGLHPLQEYLLNFNLNWNVEEYIKKLPEIEIKFKKQKEENQD